MKRKYIYMSLLSVSMLLGSCKDESLDQQPYNGLPYEVITSENNLQAAVNGMYASLRDYRAFGRNIPIMGDLMADNILIAQSNSGRYLTQNAYAATETTVESADIWSYLYRSILRANTVINSNVSTNENVDQLVGEAYAVRALCHFELVKFFAQPYTVNPNAPGVPIVTTFDQNLSPARNTVTEVYAQINADLDKAYSLMSADVQKNSSYFSKYAAKALQARAYLFMGDYEKARDAALDVVNNSGYSLVPTANYVSYWNNPTPNDNKVETLFEISIDAVDNNGSNALSNMYDPAGYGDMLATKELFNLYEVGDVRKSLIEEQDEEAGIRPAYVVFKYPNTENAADKDDIKVIRYSEVMLILAESYARTGNEALALTTLNTLTSNRNASAYASSGAQLIEDIITERRKELAFEGHRYWDFMRLNLVIQRTSALPIPASATTVAVNDPKRIQPIPQGEQDANPNIEPNPGY